jgi:hypothetical protein
MKWRHLRPPVGCAPRWSPAAQFSTVSLLRPAARGNTDASLQKPRKRCLSSVHEGAKSLSMKPPQKQFSLNRAASRKQIPISSIMRFGMLAALSAFVSMSKDSSAQSQPTFTRVTPSGQLSWTTEKGHHYQLQKTPAIIPPIVWTNLGPAVLGTGNVVTNTDTNLITTQFFYRVAVTNASACTNSGGPSYELPSNLGNLRGDTAFGFACLTVCQSGPTRTGCGSGWFKIRLREDSNCVAHLRLDLQLQTPTDADYNLYLYRTGAVLVKSSENGIGVTENIVHTISDGSGSDESQDLWIEVRHISGASFNNWTLRTSGGSGPCY